MRHCRTALSGYCNGSTLTHWRTTHTPMTMMKSNLMMIWSNYDECEPLQVLHCLRTGGAMTRRKCCLLQSTRTRDRAAAASTAAGHTARGQQMCMQIFVRECYDSSACVCACGHTELNQLQSINIIIGAMMSDRLRRSMLLLPPHWTSARRH